MKPAEPDADLPRLEPHIDWSRSELAQAGSLPPGDRGDALLKHFRTREYKPLADPPCGDLEDPERVRRFADAACENRLLIMPGKEPYDFGPSIQWLDVERMDSETFSRLHRHLWWPMLARQFGRSKDDKYAEAWRGHFASWRNAAGGESAAAKSIWRPLAVAVRARSWIYAFREMIQWRGMDGDLLLLWLGWFERHAKSLIGRFEPMNHGLFEAEALFHISLAFPEFRDAREWRNICIDYFSKQMNEQVERDGVHKERSIYYQMDCASLFLRMHKYSIIHLDENVFGDDYTQRLTAMVNVIRMTTHPDGKIPMFGDSLAIETAPFIKEAEEWMPDIAKRAEKMYHEDPPHVFFAPAGGYISMRDRWNSRAFFFILKNSPHGGAHTHEDNLSFELSALGGRRITDTGTYTYDENNEDRRWAVSAHAHSVVVLNGQPNNLNPRWLWKKIENGAFVAALENQAGDRWTHRRTVALFPPDGLLLIDDVLGDAGGKVDLRIHLAPSKLKTRPQKNMAKVRYPDWTRGRIVSLCERDVRLQKKSSWMSQEYETKIKRPYYRMVIQNDEPNLRIATALAFRRWLPAKLKLTSNAPLENDRDLDLTIRLGRKEYAIQGKIGENTVTISRPRKQ